METYLTHHALVNNKCGLFVLLYSYRIDTHLGMGFMGWVTASANVGRMSWFAEQLIGWLKSRLLNACGYSGERSSGDSLKFLRSVSWEFFNVSVRRIYGVYSLLKRKLERRFSCGGGGSRKALCRHVAKNAYSWSFKNDGS